MKNHGSSKTGQTLRIAVGVSIAVCGILSAGAAEETAKAPPAPVVVVVERGVVRNLVHRFKFPVPSGWSVSDGATAEELQLEAVDCEECFVRVKVSPGNTLPLADTVKTILAQIQANPNAKVLGQEGITVAGENGYTVVKSESASEPESAPSDEPRPEPVETKTRFVTFSHAGDKYYVVLRAPGNRFGKDDAALDKLLGKFRFGSALGGLFK
jgi:hypothetical protein